MPGQTPFQTIGPFFHDGLSWEGGEDLVRPETRGERIAIRGRVLDGDARLAHDVAGYGAQRLAHRQSRLQGRLVVHVKDL